MKKNNQSLHISEKFYSIQGEGKSSGYPAIFIRLSGCNLLCKSDSWICDSIEVWRKGNSTNFEDVFNELDIERLKNGAHLIITGGEPMLHQKNIASFLAFMQITYNFIPFVEIETNGTISPQKELVFDVKQWNVSPKLLNSGEKFEKRFNREVFEKFNKLNSIFKFVVEKEEDVIEIFTNYGYLNKNRIYLMPAGETQEKLNQIRLEVIELCKKYILKYTDRIHIVAWNKKTGV